MIINKRTTSKIILYSIANYIHTVINAISNIFVSNILGPTYNGVISYYNAILTNVDQVVFSTFRSSVEREVPQIENGEQKIKYAQQAQVLNFYSSLFFSVFFLFFGLFETTPFMRTSAYMVSFFSFFRSTSDFYRIWNKSLNRISLVSTIMIITSMLIPVFAILFSYWFSLHGFWIGRIILQIVTLSCFIIISKEFFKLCKPDFSIIKKLLISGGEIVMFSLFVSGIQTMDKYFVKSAMGIEQLGFYAIGSMIFTMLMLIPYSITGAVYPRFVGMVNDNLEPQVRKFSIYIEILCVFAAVIVYQIIPFLIKSFMPLYEKSILIVRILLIAFVSYSSVQLKYIDIIRKKNMKQLIFNVAIAFILGILLYVFIYKYFASIENFAWGTSLCFFMLSLGVNFSWARTYHYGFRRNVLLAFFSIIPTLMLVPLFIPTLSGINAILIIFCSSVLIYLIRIKIVHL